MKAALQRSFRLILPGVAGGLMILMAGCSNGSPGGAAETGAKNLFAIEHNYDPTTQLEGDIVVGFPANSTGNVSPATSLSLVSNVYGQALAMAADGTLYVAVDTDDSSSEILVYAPGATGTAAPTATITGGVAGTFTAADYLAVKSTGQLLVLSDDGSVETFAVGATGAATPVGYLSYGVSHFGSISGIGTDASGEIFVASYANSAVYAFAAGATGADAPVRAITGTDTAIFGALYTMTVDPAGEVVLANYNPSDDPFGEAQGAVHAQSPRARQVGAARFGRAGVRPHGDPEPVLATGIVVFAAGATGTPTPTRFLAGALTTVNEPEALAVDGLSNVFYQDFEGGTLTMMAFGATATGNVAPASSMTSSVFGDPYSGTMAAF